MLDMELHRKKLVQILQEHLPGKLAEIDAAKGDGFITPAPAPDQYYPFPLLSESVVVWPVCLVLTRRATRMDQDDDPFRRYEFDVEFWFFHADQMMLQVFVERIAQAATLVLEDESNWKDIGAIYPEVADALFSNVLPSQEEEGLLRACRLVFHVRNVG